jgi:chitinase
VHYGFALTTSDGSILALPAGEEPILQHFVQVAHQNNVKASLSIGGWSGSRFFSSAVATAQSRTALVAAVVGFVNKYKLDGIDIDWEYPDKEGMCNQFSPQDSANLLSFLAQLRKDPVGSRLTITAAVSITPFTGPSGDPMSDVSQFAKVLDYIAIMDYDVWGRWTRPALVGPNAPLDDACDNQHARQGSAASAVAAWTAAGFPARQIILAVAAYGHSFHVDPAAAYPNGDTTLAAYPPFDPAQQPKGDSRDALSPGGIGPCGTSEPSGYSGVFSFAGLIEDGFLKDNGVNADGIGYRFDDCSQTVRLCDS